MNTELFTALELLEKQKGIPCEYMCEKIEAALVSAFKKEYGATAVVRILLDPAKKDLRVYQQKTVVEIVEDPICQISLEDAKAISKRYTVDSIVETEVPTKNLRRLSAGAAKSVIIQGIREGERQAVQRAYENQREEIITATVSKIDYETGAVILEAGNSRLVLKQDDQIKGETFAVGQQIRVYVAEINKEMRGPLVTISRTHPGLVRRMFESEIPEISDGTVLIKAVSREAGSRTKIAVMSRDEDVDAVGACIGSHGMRINGIVDELNGEKIDIIPYSENPEEFIAAALAPAQVCSVTMVAEKACRVLVPADQLSLAIGKEGQNARLAARLTGYKIDIKSEE